MAYVNIERVIDHLSAQMKRSLERTIENTLPGVQIERTELFREFKRAVRAKCNTWERVPDRFVREE